MAAISRREFLEKSAVGSAMAGVLAAGGARVGANPLGLPIGSQTYPHRQLIADGKFVDLLKQLKSIGVDQIELCGSLPGGTFYQEFNSLMSDPKAVRKQIEDNGLKAISCHFMFTELRDNLQRAIAWSKDMGLEQIMVPTIKSAIPGQPISGPNPLDEAKQLVDQFHKMAEQIVRAGMRAGAHNEAFDLVKLPDGTFVYDHVIQMTDPKLIGFQFQMSTYSVGMVASEYFKKHPGRFFSMHVQDLDIKAGRTPVVNGRGGGYAQTAVGQGGLDWAGTFAAARTGGVKNFFVEQNMEMTKASVAALKAMKS
ncbi:MAG: sugar phosphate isomerase/epimerase [Acidobacteria bacterium]|nr:sugar phosphate isomerase/epimerase [Acidobacteriota bacterium]